MTSLYADDPDVHADYAITDSTGGTNDFTPTVTTGATELAGDWLGDPAATRTLRVPLTGLTTGHHDLRLVIPGANDVYLGRVVLN